MEAKYFNWLLWGWIALAAVTFVALLFVRAPYGRYLRAGYGPVLGRRLGWVLMELPSAVGMALLFALSERRDNLPAFVFMLLWTAHYFHRTFIFPFQLARGPGHSLTTVLLAVAFNVGNVYFNGRWLFFLGPQLEESWLTDPRFVLGVLIFAGGFILCKHSDAILIDLRRRFPGEYRIPQGGAFRWVSCPNYLGEITEWFGWAILTWSIAGLSFALWTVANLAPRAWHHHRFYLEKFPDYPKERRALVPFVV